MKKILFITAFFYPQNKIPTLRIGQWVKYLALNGYSVTVLTTKKYSFIGPLGLEVKLPDNVTVIEVDFLPKILKKMLEKDRRINQQINNSKKIYHLKSFIKRII